jgi:RHS repeat-associated protein
VYERSGSTQGALLATYEKLVTDAGATTWEELALGAELNRAVFLKVTIENTSTPMLARFDDLKIEVFNAPTAMVVQENSYYPFGGNMRGLDYTLNPTKEDKFTFQGKEKQTDFGLNWYDFEARMYDGYGRTTTIDPHAENYYSLSPYSFLGNNPLFFTDPTGKDLEIQAGKYEGEAAQNLFRQLQANSRRQPNYEQARGLSSYMGEVAQIGAKNMNELVKLHGAGGFGMGSQNSSPRVGRYLYSKSWGWLDLRHFMSAYNNGIRGGLQGGEVVEAFQDLTEDNSAYEPEDLPSNLMGAYFNIYMRSKQAIRNGDKIDEIATLGKYLTMLGFVDDLNSTSAISGYTNDINIPNRIAPNRDVDFDVAKRSDYMPHRAYPDVIRNTLLDRQVIQHLRRYLGLDSSVK